jgi:5-methylcytosine-specific restriction endonuclease McrA
MRKENGSIVQLNKTDFQSVLEPIHRTYWQKAYKKLSAKMSSLKGSLKRRSEHYEVEFNISSQEIRELFVEVYGQGCKYCDKQLTFRTIACDHIIPLSKDGKSTKENLQLICRTCNTRKGPLNESDFKVLIQLVQELPDELSTYVMRKLAKGGRY